MFPWGVSLDAEGQPQPNPKYDIMRLAVCLGMCSNKNGAYRDSNSELSLESGALPACPFPAGTLIVCRAVYLFLHCAHFIALSMSFLYSMCISSQSKLCRSQSSQPLSRSFELPSEQWPAVLRYGWGLLAEGPNASSGCFAYGRSLRATEHLFVCKIYYLATARLRPSRQPGPYPTLSNFLKLGQSYFR